MADRSIKLYHYNASPYARKVVWYLALRQIPYAEVKQPVIMPRPDLDAIGVKYRRIPVMTIGKDVYCDTRIILRKLEELFPEGTIGATTPDTQAIQKMLEVWHVEGPMFWKGVQSMPPGLFADPKFAKDREQMTGRSWNPEELGKLRPEGLTYIASYFSFVEKLLSDGRKWIVSTDRPSLADIEAIFVVHWLRGAKALPEELVSQLKYPQAFAWMDRFDNAVKTAQKQGTRPTGLNGPTAAKQILGGAFAEPEMDMSFGQSRAGPKRGDHVEVFPTDSGSNNKDQGVLSALTEDEIVINLDNGLRLHTPRAGFRVRQIASKI